MLDCAGVPLFLTLLVGVACLLGVAFVCGYAYLAFRFWR